MIKSPEGLIAITKKIAGLVEPVREYFDRRLMRKEVGIYQAGGWLEGITYDGFAGMDGKFWPDTHMIGTLLSNLPNPPKVGVIEFRRTKLGKNEWVITRATNTAGENIIPTVQEIYKF